MSAIRERLAQPALAHQYPNARGCVSCIRSEHCNDLIQNGIAPKEGATHTAAVFESLMGIAARLTGPKQSRTAITKDTQENVEFSTGPGERWTSW